MKKELPKKYHKLEEARTKTWYRGVIRGCKILLVSYRKGKAHRDECPFCIMGTYNGCVTCPWIVYNKRDCGTKKDGITVDWYDTYSFPERVKRLNRWIKRSERGLARLEKGEKR